MISDRKLSLLKYIKQYLYHKLVYDELLAMEHSLPILHLGYENKRTTLKGDINAMKDSDFIDYILNFIRHPVQIKFKKSVVAYRPLAGI